MFGLAFSSTRRRVWLWLMVWMLATAFGTAIHVLVWRPGPPVAIAELHATKVLTNLNHLITSPGWVLVNLTTGFWKYASIPTILFANGFGWTLVIVAVAIAIRVRRRLLLQASAASSSSEQSSPVLARRRFLINAVTGVSAGAVSLALAEAAVLEPWRMSVRRYSVPIRGLPRSLAGFKIVQISDTHLGPRISASHIEKAVELALSLKPDLVALTGDYIHAGSTYIDRAASLFRPLTDRVPVVGTLGNHDWHSDGRGMAEALREVGVAMIDNTRVFLDGDTRALASGGGRDGLCIAGFGDLWKDSIRPDEALYGVAPELPRLVLSHNPDSAEEMIVWRAGAPRIDLMLSGHTHGGQVYVPGVGTPFLPSRYGQKYAGGLCQGPRFPVVVSRGVGMSIFPLRLGVPPELVVVELTQA